MKRLSLSTYWALILGAGALIVWVEFSWLACEAMGTLRPGEFEACRTYYGTVQDHTIRRRDNG